MGFGGGVLPHLLSRKDWMESFLSSWVGTSSDRLNDDDDPDGVSGAGETAAIGDGSGGWTVGGMCCTVWMPCRFMVSWGF